MPGEPKDVKEIFLLACEKPTSGERTAFLDEACAGDAELRHRVEVLLKAHEEAGSFLQGPATEVRDLAQQKSTIPDNRIGPYKLLQLLGEGGMGAVWMAEQEEPVRRRVAIKIIKAGMSSDRVLARFEQERQALALMDHPNIAKVLEAGETASGRPYFVMEMIKGIPITKYCDQEHLTPRERLELFIPVCQAVQHAHQKGIIHRDLKPFNVLIALYDGKPVPKVIDFGVAKATAQKLTDKTMFTEVGQMVGTVEYMAPEQAELNNLDIDTRADIYALGVILYELLTGSPPFSSKQLRGVAFDEMLRTIREVEPSRPSTKLSSSEQLPALAAKRKLEPKKLTRLIHGDLDWIVMKALAKDRARRYETANGFALDVQRYLSNEPVSAGPPSRTYQLKKFLQRNKGPVLAATLLLLALVGGILGTTMGFVQADRARQEEQTQRHLAENRQVEADEARDKESAQRVLAQANEKQAKEEKQIAQAVRDFLQKKLLNQADVWEQADVLLKAGVPSTQVKRNPTIRELLDRAAVELSADRIEGQFPKQPLLQAEILQTIGNTYRAVGEFRLAFAHTARARDLRRQELGPDSLETLESLVELANTQREAGRLPEAIQLYEQARDFQVAKLGPDHPDTLLTLNGLAVACMSAGKVPEAIRLLQQVREKRIEILGLDHPHTLNTLGNLAAAYSSAGKLPEAVQLFEQVRDRQLAKLGAHHPRTLRAMNNLAGAYISVGNVPEAIRLLEQIREPTALQFGADHPETLGILNNLAVVYESTGKVAEAIRLYEQVKDHELVKLGPDHANTLMTLNNLALAYLHADKLPEAIYQFERVRDRRSTTLGVDHADTLMTMCHLATAYQGIGRTSEAIALFERALQQQVAKLEPDHPDTLSTLHNLALAYWSADNLPAAIRTCEEAWKKRVVKLGPEHPHTLMTLNNLAMAYRCAGRLRESIHLFEQARDLREAKLGRDDTATLISAMNVAETHSLAGAYERAQALLRELLARERGRKPPDELRVAGILASLGESLLQAGRASEAEPLLRECLALRERQAPRAWKTFFAKSLLGGALLGQQKYVDAEPLLRAGAEGMKALAIRTTPAAKPRLVVALERLVQLYVALGKKEDEAKWRKELEATKVVSSKKP